jgi:hypothetical protein
VVVDGNTPIRDISATRVGVWPASSSSSSNGGRTLGGGSSCSRGPGSGGPHPGGRRRVPEVPEESR